MVSQRWHTDVQASEKVLNIINLQGNVNQNYREISPHTCRDGYYQKDNKYQVLAKMCRKETLVHFWWVHKSVQPLWKTVWRVLKKFKIELPYDAANPLLGIYLKKRETLIWKDIHTSTFTEALFTIAKIWKNLSAFNKWIDKEYVVYMQFSQKKRMKSCHLWHEWASRVLC